MNHFGSEHPGSECMLDSRGKSLDIRSSRSSPKSAKVALRLQPSSIKPFVAKVSKGGAPWQNRIFFTFYGLTESAAFMTV
jgi:hypothetical protein